MKAHKILALLALTGMALAGCSDSTTSESTTSTPSSTQNAQAKDAKDSTKENHVAYYADYQLEAATYHIEFGHTHEKFMRIAFVPTEGVTDLMAAGKAALNTNETTVEQKQTVTITPNNVYYVKMGHYSGRVDFTVPSAGKWAVFADIAPGNALPWKLRNAADEPVAPITERVLDNSTNDIYDGYFENSQVKDRELSDYAGNWQSVYPLLQDGSLDKVMAHKAESGKKTKEEWTAYYETGYRTDIEKIDIAGNEMSFTKNGQTAKATYAYERYEILTYQKGNRGVRFLFTKQSGDEAAPKFVQFSDHNIFPVKASHFHIYMGNTSHEELLKEMDNWPTYYPASLTKDEIVEEMMGH
ncbi:metal-binding protein ZinT [Trueperella sp. LYQ143]|uniref:metal-binding protein ZinT n=1 Tax=unclassified Trueperella TaxID=2630174 RepID=UPI003983849D